jgi:hypothetical protein
VVALVAAGVDVNRVRQAGHAVQRLHEPAGVVPLEDEELLEYREPLRLPPPKDGVDHAIGFKTEEQLHALRRQVDLDPQQLVAGVRGHRIAVAHDAAVAAIPVVLLPENPVLRLLVLELVQLLAEALLLLGGRPVALVVEHVALAQRVPVRVSLGEQLLLGIVDRAQQLPIDVAVPDADRGRALVHGVLEEVRGAVLAIALRKRAESILERRGHARHAMVLDQHDTEPVLEDELVRVESEERPVFRAEHRSALRARSSALPEEHGSETRGETEDDHTQTRHIAAPPS